MMIIFLPAKVVRGAMEPDIVKSADGYKSDIKALAQIPSYRSTLIGVTCSNMITGAATVFFPEFVSIAAVITGNVDPCVQPPCEYTNIVFRFGLITILAGFGGAVFGIYATKLGHGRNNHLIEAELCGFGCMLAAISVYIVTVFCKFFLLHTCNYFFLILAVYSLMTTWIFSFFCIFGVSINWGLSVELVIKVTSPQCRSTAKALFHLLVHSLGDAPAPLIIGLLADYFHSKEPIGQFS